MAQVLGVAGERIEIGDVVMVGADGRIYRAANEAQSVSNIALQNQFRNLDEVANPGNSFGAIGLRDPE